MFFQGTVFSSIIIVKAQLHKIIVKDGISIEGKNFSSSFLFEKKILRATVMKMDELNISVVFKII